MHGFWTDRTSSMFGVPAVPVARKPRPTRSRHVKARHGLSRLTKACQWLCILAPAHLKSRPTKMHFMHKCRCEGQLKQKCIKTLIKRSLLIATKPTVNFRCFGRVSLRIGPPRKRPLLFPWIVTSDVLLHGSAGKPTKTKIYILFCLLMS
jgi:hypothetical protein